MSGGGKAAKGTKTNAARLLDSLGIGYELRAYEVDPEDLTAISVAKKIGMPAEPGTACWMYMMRTGTRRHRDTMAVHGYVFHLIMTAQEVLPKRASRRPARYGIHRMLKTAG